MLRSLWKLQWKQFAARMKKGNGKKTSGGWLVFLMLFIVVCMEILMFVVFAALVPLCEMGLTWLYFAMAGTMALALSMLGSVFMTQAQLYDAKDNERLLSMPIPPKYILLTRIAMLFTTTAGYTLAVLLPAFGIYAFSYGASATMMIGWLFTFVALSLISQSVCCALGWVLHKLLSRLRNKAVVSLLYMVIFMAVYWYFYANVNSFLSGIVMQGTQIAGAMKYVWPLYAIGMACGGSLLHTLLVTVLSAAIALFTLWRLSASFISSVRTSGAKAGAKHKSGKASAKQRTPVLSVAHKEQRKFFTSPAYLMNFGFGLVVIPVLPIAAAIFRGKLMQMISLMGVRPEWIALGIFGVMAFWHRDVLRDRAVCLVGGQKSVGSAHDAHKRQNGAFGQAPYGVPPANAACCRQCFGALPHRRVRYRAHGADRLRLRFVLLVRRHARPCDEPARAAL